MGADRGRKSVHRAPRVQCAPQLAQHAAQVGHLLFQQPAHVDAWRRAGATKRDDMSNFGEGETKPARAADEDQHIERVRGVQPVSCWRAAWRRENASRFV